jgi:hypothetical protein
MMNQQGMNRMMVPNSMNMVPNSMNAVPNSMNPGMNQGGVQGQGGQGGPGTQTAMPSVLNMISTLLRGSQGQGQQDLGVEAMGDTDMRTGDTDMRKGRMQDATRMQQQQQQQQPEQDRAEDGSPLQTTSSESVSGGVLQSSGSDADKESPMDTDYRDSPQYGDEKEDEDEEREQPAPKAKASQGVEGMEEGEEEEEEDEEEGRPRKKGADDDGGLSPSPSSSPSKFELFFCVCVIRRWLFWCVFWGGTSLGLVVKAVRWCATGCRIKPLQWQVAVS